MLFPQVTLTQLHGAIDTFFLRAHGKDKKPIPDIFGSTLHSGIKDNMHLFTYFELDMYRMLCIRRKETKKYARDIMSEPYYSQASLNSNVFWHLQNQGLTLAKFLESQVVDVHSRLGIQKARPLMLGYVSNYLYSHIGNITRIPSLTLKKIAIKHVRDKLAKHPDILNMFETSYVEFQPDNK
ncbi:MAG: hypothetical protein ACI8Y7_000538 [Candidatus Woesearchaeota archaeon]|jgi:hypothetical protein